MEKAWEKEKQRIREIYDSNEGESIAKKFEYTRAESEAFTERMEKIIDAWEENPSLSDMLCAMAQASESPLQLCIEATGFMLTFTKEDEGGLMGEIKRLAEQLGVNLE